MCRHYIYCNNCRAKLFCGGSKNEKLKQKLNAIILCFHWWQTSRIVYLYFSYLQQPLMIRCDLAYVLGSIQFITVAEQHEDSLGSVSRRPLRATDRSTKILASARSTHNGYVESLRISYWLCKLNRVAHVQWNIPNDKCLKSQRN